MRFFVMVAPVAVLLAFASFAAASGSSHDSDGPRIWALLVAGSNTYDNYRHQADICHAYQILHRHGIPDERIVVMMYDDIANNTYNPTKGVIINHPKGPNVYPGVPKDYTGDAVTPRNFLHILKGDKEGMRKIGSGKVIESNANDHIFVYFSDHGGPGVIAFPNDYLSAKDLVDTIVDMHDKRRYAHLVFYLEACFSGSMFHGLLPKDINVYATTAASPTESSYACYFDDERDTYLGDLYSVSWMEDSDVEVLSKETLQEQFKIVKKETVESTVETYGDLTIGTHFTISQFQGNKPAQPQRLPRVNRDAVDSRDVPVAILKRKIQKASDENTRAQLQSELNELQRKRMFLRNKVAQIAVTLGQTDAIDRKTPPRNLDYNCYWQVVDRFNDICFNLAHNTYSLGHMHTLANLCDSPRSITTDDILATLESTCVHDKVVGIV